MKNYFGATEKAPHHISIGAILINKDKKIGCHYYGTPSIRNYPTNFYTLMHESIEPNETLEQTLARGLAEEFSVTAELVRYVGSLVVPIGNSIEKTVLYFLCTLTGVDEIRNISDPESISEIKWVDIEELIVIMKEQGQKFGASADESKILEDVLKYYL